MKSRSRQGALHTIDQDGLEALFAILIDQGYQLVGPTLREEAIVYDTIGGVGDLPAGWTDRQEAGSYQLERRTDRALFGYAVGPHSWKRYLHPPVEVLWRARQREGQLKIEAPEPPRVKYAFIGVRACELRAIAIQDRVFRDGLHTDSAYAARRDNAFIVAVNCAQAGGTCFCVSMDSGPKVTEGFDLCLTELLENGRHKFLLQVGSDQGAAVVEKIASRAASTEEVEQAEAIVQQTAESMGRTLDTEGIKELLQSNPNHPRWSEVAERCLSCANCTMVCPTCFCTTVDDHTDLTTTTAERRRRWDSCFTMDFSYIHGGSVRHSAGARYRQWMTHKLANWIDQFGSSGCVGCGRCITWCPVGIDITEEAAAIRANSVVAEQGPDEHA